MERYRYKLHTLAPVHIGTGETMLPIEFQISDDSMLMWIPELERVFEQRQDLTEVFARRLMDTQPSNLTNAMIGGLLAGVNFQNPSILKYSTKQPPQKNYGYFGLKTLREQVSQKKNSEVRLAVKSPDYRLYIPGSSIKGAMKTAWAYDYCKKNSKILTDISKVDGDRKAHALVQNLFQSDEGKDANYDLFRVLQIGDTEPVKPEDALYVVAARVLSAAVRPGSKNVPAQWKNYWIFCEAVARETTHTGSAAMNMELLSDKNAQRELKWREEQREFSLQSLCRAVNSFALDICNWEIEYFSKIIQTQERCETESVLKLYRDYWKKQLETIFNNASENTCYLSIGYGSGWHKMTVGMLLERELGDKFKVLREKLGLAKRHTEFDYPKSRKLIKEGKATYPFGWVKLEFERIE